MEKLWTVELLIRRCNRLSGLKSATTKETVTTAFVFCNPRLHNEVTNNGEKWRGGEETRTTGRLPLLDVTYEEEKQQHAAYTPATNTQKGYRHLSEAQELQFKTLNFLNKKSFQGQDTLLRKLSVRVALPTWYEFAVCN